MLLNIFFQAVSAVPYYTHNSGLPCIFLSNCLLLQRARVARQTQDEELKLKSIEFSRVADTRYRNNDEI